MYARIVQCIIPVYYYYTYREDIDKRTGEGEFNQERAKL